MKKKDELVTLDIDHQGTPSINCATIIAISDETVLIDIDCHSKYLEVSAHSNKSGPIIEGQMKYIPGIVVDFEEHSLHPFEGVVAEDNWTEIHFPEFAGYSVFATNVGRYTVNVALMKDTVYETIGN